MSAAPANAKFQSLTGRLQTGDFLAVAGNSARFQSLTGRLQTGCVLVGAGESLGGFNPSQVGYKRGPGQVCPESSVCFNPSQVGYKPEIPAQSPLIPCWFQSLTGRLQTGGLLGRLITWLLFQSLTGRLQTISARCSARCRACFNPSQVGYKLSAPCCFSGAGLCFNPSQVGYKLIIALSHKARHTCFNPSQVGYKLSYIRVVRCSSCTFQSLTGRLQTL